jgi:hypothetical protein
MNIGVRYIYITMESVYVPHVMIKSKRRWKKLSENERKVDISYILKKFSYSTANDIERLLGGTFCKDARRYSEF